MLTLLVRVMRHMFLGQCCTKHSSAMLIEAYLTYSGAKKQYRVKVRSPKVNFGILDFFGKRHMFCGQFYLRNTIEVIRSAYEVILGHK